MSLYSDMQSVVGEILSDPDFKQGVMRYGVVTPGTGPVDDPGTADPTWTVVIGAARGIQFQYVNNGMAAGSELQVAMAVQTGITPKIADFFEIDGIPYKINKIIPKPAAGTVVAYVLLIGK